MSPVAPAPVTVFMGYARVSTDDQDYQLQIDALVKAGVEPGRIYKEKISGAADDRPAFVAVFKALRPGDTLVVWKLDRLGRNLGRLIHTIDRLKEKQVHLKVLTESIDTSTPVGTLMFHIIGAFAEFERNVGRERTMAGLAAAKAKGRVGGRKPVMTPEKLEEAKRLMADEAEGGEGLSMTAAAKRIGVGKSTLARDIAEAAEKEGADDLEA